MNHSSKETNQQVASRTPIPLELTRLIIDECHSDIHTLGECSLVCKYWMLIARYHLFSDVKISGNRRLLHRFSGLLSSLLCTFSCFVRSLSMRYIEPKDVNLTLPKFTGLLEITNMTLHTTPSSFAMQFISPSSLATLCSFSHLTILDLTVYFQQFSHFTEIVSGFPKLEDLRAEVNFANPASWDISHRPSAHLHSLRVTWSTVDILQWLLSLRPVPAIKNLDVSADSNPNIHFIGKYLQSVGDKLKTFTLSCYNVVDGLEHVYQDFNLAVNTTLQSMALNSYFMPPILIEYLISQLNSPDFRELKLESFCLGVGGWHSVDRQLSEIFSLRRFMIICSYIDPIVSEEEVRAAFPRCNDRGILNIQYEVDDL
ncbi:hypothetical protein BDQ12DRAFT_766038 [Crucibulum laeve]|uniref:F-box domain-containing protein n=1 Tax=Crucibulum laeve TaxID=68775 RepID=A0A5C3LYA3_9AGAR|nr:hypothetical protein BDQ12DRAFT_766038 [Crucibulum laeve]